MSGSGGYLARVCAAVVHTRSVIDRDDERTVHQIGVSPCVVVLVSRRDVPAFLLGTLLRLLVAFLKPQKLSIVYSLQDFGFPGIRVVKLDRIVRRDVGRLVGWTQLGCAVLMEALNDYSRVSLGVQRHGRTEEC